MTHFLCIRGCFVCDAQRGEMLTKVILESMARIEKRLQDRASVVDIPMSAASRTFYSPLLDELMIKYVVELLDQETGGGSALEPYAWGENETEAEGQPGCQKILEGEILPIPFGNEYLGLFDARNLALPELTVGKQKSNGFSDLALSPTVSMTHALTNAKDHALAYTVALVELKTGQAEQKLGQLLLQLVSLSMVSGTNQGVVVLGTDCATKWLLLHFSDFNKIIVQPYRHGKKCLADFKNLILARTARMEKNVAPPRLVASSINADDETDLNMQDFGVEETLREKAIAREDKLRRLASTLGSIFGETPEVPSWAKASETCPSYDDMM
jgi:hypothetical protein